MKVNINITIAIFFMLFWISCSKENLNKPNSSTLQSSENSNTVTSFSIGQAYHGGIIFYIDSSGKHGLIVSDEDLTITDNAEWKKSTNVITGATGTAVGSGKENTDKIVAIYGTAGQYAAALCARYRVSHYKDWYLPSKDELNLLYKKKDKVGNLSSGNYWSSSEVTKGRAWDQEFATGVKFKEEKFFVLEVRAISSF